MRCCTLSLSARRSLPNGGALLMAAFALVVLDAGAEPLSLDPHFLRDAAALDAGPIQIYPALALQYGYDSNIYESRQHVRDADFSLLSPELTALLPFDSGAAQAIYQAERIQYDGSSDDNFTDQLLLGRLRFEPSARQRIAGDYSWNATHEARGTGLTEGFDPQQDAASDSGPDALTDRRAHLKYEFGALTAPGNLRFALDSLQRDYTNHRQRTEYFDRDEIGADATFLWRVQPRTSLLLEARARDVDYATKQPGEPSLDSREYDYLTGVEWTASEQTRVGFRVGSKSKQFAAAQRNDSDVLAWEIDGRWAPRSYSVVEANFNRSPGETNGQGDFIDIRSYTLAWRHEWNQRFSTKVGGYYDQRIYKGVNEDQNTHSFQLELNYRMFRWLNWQVACNWRERSSEVEVLNMTRNRYTLGFELTL